MTKYEAMCILVEHNKEESYESIISVMGVIDLLKTQDINKVSPTGGSDIQSLYLQIDAEISKFKYDAKDKIPTSNNACWYDAINMPHYQAEESLKMCFRGIFSIMQMNFYNKYLS